MPTRALHPVHNADWSEPNETDPTAQNTLTQMRVAKSRARGEHVVQEAHVATFLLERIHAGIAALPVEESAKLDVSRYSVSQPLNVTIHLDQCEVSP